jgi:glycosyltransferase involved in cell wall biosynthesis
VIEQTAREQRVDLVYATQSWMAEHARAAGLDAIAVDVDDLISLMSRQRLRGVPWGVRKPLRIAEAAKDIAYERSLPRRFSQVVVAKAEDQNFFDAKDRDRVFVVPNGITVPPVALPEPPVADTLLFIGTLGYEPNIDAVRWFASEALPLVWQQRPDVRFDVAGFGSGAALREVLSDPRCSIHESPPDLTPLYARAAVVIAPVRIGGGTRIKILEALANGRAMVSTVFAAEGLALRGGIDIEYADSAGAIAAMCIALLADPERRRALAASGRARVAEQFDWERIEQRLPKLILDFAEHRGTVTKGPVSRRV